MEEEMVNSIGRIAKDHSKGALEGLLKLCDNISKGMNPKDAMGIGDAQFERIYAKGYQLFNIGKFDEAEPIFGALIVSNPLEPKYVFAYAASAHMQKKYEKAAEYYMKLSLLTPDDPVPYYHASDCYIQLKDDLSALAALKLTINKAKDKKEYSIIKDRATLTYENLLKEQKSKK